METISGLTNWRLTVRRETEGVTILRAVTCDENAALPDEIFGLPVTGVIDEATWYRLVSLYTGILRLAEINSLAVLGQILSQML